MTFIFPESRKVFIRENKEFMRVFMDQAPEGKKILAAELPPLKKGFRQGHDLDVRLQIFTQRVNKWTDEDWSLWGQFWATWFRSHKQLWAAFRLESEDALEGFCQAAADAGQLKSFIIQVAAVSSVSREDVSSWYRFGPFPQDELLEEALLLVLPASLIGAPNTVKNLVEQQKAVAERLSEVVNVRKEVEGLKEATQTSQRRIEQNLGNSIKELGGEIEKVRGSLNQFKTAEDGRKEEIQGHIRALDRRLLEVEEEVHGLAKANIEWEERWKAREELGASEDPTHAIIQEDLATLKKNFEETIQGLTRQIRPFSIDPIIRPISMTGALTIEETTEALIKGVAAKLSALGLNVAMGRELARSIVVGANAGQLLTFSGSLAWEVATTCAIAINAEEAWELTVAVGTTSEKIAQAIEIRVSDGHWTVVILDGIDRVPFDVVQGALRRMESWRVVVMATLSDDLTALPIDPKVFDHGPLFELDYLLWRPSGSRSDGGGVFSGDFGFSSSPDIEGIHIDEALDVPPSQRHRWRQAWKRTVYRAAVIHNGLFAITNTDCLSALAYGWILPYLSRHDRTYFDTTADLVTNDHCAASLIDAVKAEDL